MSGVAAFGIWIVGSVVLAVIGWTIIAALDWVGEGVYVPVFRAIIAAYLVWVAGVLVRRWWVKTRSA